MKPPHPNPLRPTPAQRANEAAAFSRSMLRHGERQLSLREIIGNQAAHKLRSKKP